MAYFITLVAASTAWRVHQQHPVARASALKRSDLSMMVQWTRADLKRKAKPVPDEVDELLASDFPSRGQVPIMWAALRDCYATEAEAIAAAKRYPSLVLPYMNSPGNIVGCFNVLVDTLGREGARSVCVQNPAVLGNDPVKLSLSSAKDIQDSANLREWIDLKLPFGLRFWAGAFAAISVCGIAAKLASVPS